MKIVIAEGRFSRVAADVCGAENCVNAMTISDVLVIVASLPSQQKT
ncbi:hypothetical protein XACN24_14955 [Xanthomonas albilineans]|nr:hypothetical protein [Xanthomonas albilineans]